MSDEDWTLTDERIAELLERVRSYPCPQTAVCADETERTGFALYIVAEKALSELQRHRSALAADGERVRSVVRDAVMDVCEHWRYEGKAVETAATLIATRAAEQLATAGVGLSITERVEADALLEHLVEQRTEATNDGRSGDAEAFNDWHTVLAKLLGAPK